MPKEKEIPPSMERNAFLSMDNNRQIKTSGETLHSAETKKASGTNSQLKSKSEATKSIVSVVAGGFAGIIAKTGIICERIIHTAITDLTNFAFIPYLCSRCSYGTIENHVPSDK